MLLEVNVGSITEILGEGERMCVEVELGVDLKKLEMAENAADFVVKLDHERDVVPRLRFLIDTIGLPITHLGAWITSNPWIFKQSLEDLQVRYNYLESKKLSRYQIACIVADSPFWLNMPVNIVDDRLGYIQNDFALSGKEVRHVATQAPKLVIQGSGHLKELRFSFLEELGFSVEEMRLMILKDPRLWTVDRELIKSNFDYLQFTIGLSHRRIAEEPQVLRAEPSMLRLRHEFLCRLGRDQYEPTLPSFIPISDLLRPDDADFAMNVARSTEEEYDTHLKLD